MTRILILLLLSALTLAGQGMEAKGDRTITRDLFVGGRTELGDVLFAALGTPANGSVYNCADCTADSTPCSGGGTGALAVRVAGAWQCFATPGGSAVAALDDLTDVDTAGASTGATFYKAAAGWVDDNTILVNPATSPNVRILSQGATLTPFALKGASAQTGDLMWFRTFGDANSAGFGPLGGYWHEGATIDGVNWLQFLFADFTAPRDVTWEDAEGTIVTRPAVNAAQNSLIVSADGTTHQIVENAAGATLDATTFTLPGVAVVANSYTSDDTDNEARIVMNSGTVSANSPAIEFSRDTNDPVLPASGNNMLFQTASGTFGCKDSTGAPCRKEIKDIVIPDPATTDSGDIQLKWAFAVTITRVSCSTNVATSTATIQFDERAEITPNTAGTDVMTAALVCDTDSQVTSTFTNASIAANAPMNLDVDAVANAPGVVRIHVEYAY